jgi:hypothetical protein
MPFTSERKMVVSTPVYWTLTPHLSVTSAILGHLIMPFTSERKMVVSTPVYWTLTPRLSVNLSNTGAFGGILFSF